MTGRDIDKSVAPPLSFEKPLVTRRMASNPRSRRQDISGIKGRIPRHLVDKDPRVTTCRHRQRELLQPRRPEPGHQRPHPIMAEARFPRPRDIPHTKAIAWASGAMASIRDRCRPCTIRFIDQPRMRKTRQNRRSRVQALRPPLSFSSLWPESTSSCRFSDMLRGSI